jgi:hypothetical protein
MADKKLVIATGVLVVGAAAVLLVDKGRTPAHDPRLGQSLLGDTALGSVDRIDVKKADKSVALTRSDDGAWRIGDAKGFAADAKKVVQLMDDLGRAKATLVAASKPDGFKELGLDAPTTVTLTDHGKAVRELQLGDARKGGGEYVAYAGESTAYVTDQVVKVDVDADAWELKTLVDVDKALVKSVAFTPAKALGKAPVTLTREKKEEDLSIAGLPDTKVAKPDAKASDAVLGRIAFTKRADKSLEQAKAAMAEPSTTVVTLFDGRTYEVRVGSSEGSGEQKEKTYYLSITAQAGAGTEAKLADGVAALNELMGQWWFEVPAYVATRFERGEADLIADKTATAPAAPGAAGAGPG